MGEQQQAGCGSAREKVVEEKAFLENALVDAIFETPREVYVDELQKYPAHMIAPAARHLETHTWCHLFSLSRDHLCEIALEIGLKLSWEQPPREIAGFTIYHFDLVSSKREQAIKAGAIPVKSMVTALHKWKREER